MGGAARRLGTKGPAPNPDRDTLHPMPARERPGITFSDHAKTSEPQQSDISGQLSGVTKGICLSSNTQARENPDFHTQPRGAVRPLQAHQRHRRPEARHRGEKASPRPAQRATDGQGSQTTDRWSAAGSQEALCGPYRPTSATDAPRPSIEARRPAHAPQQNRRSAAADSLRQRLHNERTRQNGFSHNQNRLPDKMGER
jgi:hypothetical protein